DAPTSGAPATLTRQDVANLKDELHAQGKDVVRRRSGRGGAGVGPLSLGLPGPAAARAAVAGALAFISRLSARARPADAEALRRQDRVRRLHRLRHPAVRQPRIAGGAVAHAAPGPAW